MDSTSNNWGMLGHQWAVSLLSGHIANQRLRHAYLFTGAQGTGRRTLALRLAQAINCTHPPAPGDFCGECRSCRLIARMEHPDLTVVQSKEAGKTLKVEQIRELQRTLSLSPYEARYKIALFVRRPESAGNVSNIVAMLMMFLS
ncbi:MAG TPA: hypothetical protein EYP88_00265, partial [Anaerolineales bacterium]|nr:hypothetical protein [Anaerolineales bacterium]